MDRKNKILSRLHNFIREFKNNECNNEILFFYILGRTVEKFKLCCRKEFEIIDGIETEEELEELKSFMENTLRACSSVG